MIDRAKEKGAGSRAAPCYLGFPRRLRRVAEWAIDTVADSNQESKLGVVESHLVV
jgi:hypothetical protein